MTLGAHAIRRHCRYIEPIARRDPVRYAFSWRNRELHFVRNSVDPRDRLKTIFLAGRIETEALGNPPQ